MKNVPRPSPQNHFCNSLNLPQRTQRPQKTIGFFLYVPCDLGYEKFKVQGSKFKVRSAPLFMLLKRANGSCATAVKKICKAVAIQSP